MSERSGTVVAFRVDASLRIGTGHVMRCLTLASALRATGADCHFILRAHPGHLAAAIRARGFGVHVLPAGQAGEPEHEGPVHADWLGASWSDDARSTAEVLARLAPDWLVIDHYALDRRWEEAVGAHAGRVLVIDDLADRSHAADLLLDQNLGRAASDYDPLVGRDCHRLIGPRYALLREEFRDWRAPSLARRRDGRLREILVTMGGVDRDDFTGRVLDALVDWELGEGVRVTAVLGAGAPALETVREQVTRLPYPARVLVDVHNMGAVMAGADLAIGAAGSTAWERCCVGLPTLLLVLAGNQAGIAEALDRAGAGIDLSSTGGVAALSRYGPVVREPGWLERTSRHAAAITDGLGVGRVARAMHEIECGGG